MDMILLIESDPAIASHVTDVLQLASHAVMRVASGREAVSAAMEHRPNLVICTLAAKDIDGMSVLRIISSNPATKRTPFIMIGVPSDYATLRRMMEAGADDVLSTSFTDAELLGAVAARLRLSQSRHDHVSDEQPPETRPAEIMPMDNDLSALRRHGRVKKFRKGENIYAEDSTPHAIYYVVHGKVKTYRTHELGKDLITGLYGDGMFFGHIAALEEKPHTDAAQALDESEVIVIPHTEFLNVLLHSAMMSHRFLRMLADELDSKDDSLVRLAYNSVRKRVADALLALERQYHMSSPDPFHITISRENLANLAGTATETTIRTLHDFKEERLIDIKGSTIAILDLDRLKAMRN
ncbi:MAG: cyclic nucleotide-binding domain-containing protein [Candidatus Kapaibacterium sp.]